MQFFLSLITDNPAIRMVQLAVLGAAALAIYLVFYTTRDILLRTKSFLYQITSILLVAGFPIAGFLAYLLIRPASTVRQRDMEATLKKLVEEKAEGLIAKEAHKTTFNAPNTAPVEQPEEIAVP
ncbi:hypothetical protein EXS70_04765 [Candidatus Peribacteria bacterium]|nr:hypothetical protein [Candidatus Peribacteria bacterium]